MLAVVSYPTLSAADRRWIEAIRAEYDAQARAIAAHFTLVFPVELASAVLLAPVSRIAQTTRPIRFHVHRTFAVRSAFGDGGHVFLVPDEGAREIIQLHAALYCGVLAPYLRADIPFIPHLTVAQSSSFERCETLARQLDGRGVEFGGTLAGLELLRVAESITSVASFTFSAE